MFSINWHYKIIWMHSTTWLANRTKQEETLRIGHSFEAGAGWKWVSPSLHHLIKPFLKINTPVDLRLLPILTPLETHSTQWYLLWGCFACWEVTDSDMFITKNVCITVINNTEKWRYIQREHNGRLEASQLRKKKRLTRLISAQTSQFSLLVVLVTL